MTLHAFKVLILAIDDTQMDNNEHNPEEAANQPSAVTESSNSNSNLNSTKGPVASEVTSEKNSSFLEVTSVEITNLH